MKNISIVVFSIIFFGLAYAAGATTVCDDQAKPAFSCPTGYSVMCIATSNPHWGCGKESNGVIVEASATYDASTGGVRDTMQTQVKTTPSIGDPDFDLKTTSPTNPPAGDPDFDLLKIAPTVTNEGRDRTKDSDASAGKEISIGDPDFDLLNIDIGGDDLEKFRAEVSAAGQTPNVTVRGWDPKKKEEILGHPENVKTAEDLKIYAEAVALDDEAFKGITINKDSIEVKSREPGKLFWFIPVELSSTIIIRYELRDSTKDRVSVRFPWWRFLVKKDYSSGELQKEVSLGLDVSVWEKVDNSDFPVGISLVSQALQTISNVLKTRHDTVKNSISNVR